MGQLESQFDAFIEWKQHLLAQVTRYQSWLVHNHLLTPELDRRLSQANESLRRKTITIAFVGEFSRGKTELINALFFGNQHARMLPSCAGRTTMCPTELFHEPGKPTSIRLLPITTRLQATSLAELRQDQEQWHEIPLPMENTTALADALARVAETLEVSEEEALQLGFEPEHLQFSKAENGSVKIPAWRHALINIDHPLLSKGIRILDTPGLNALGLEPELTLNMLPSADAIIYLLSADTGVTASDMAIWQDPIQIIQQNRPSNLFAVLNKIDLLDDELLTPAQQQDIRSIILDTSARQLGLQADEIIAVSARQALTGKLKGHPALVANSGIETLEHLLSHELIHHQEQVLDDCVVNDLHHLLDNSRQLLEKRLQDLYTRQRQLNGSRKDDQLLVAELTEQTRTQYNQHHKRLLALKSSRRLVQQQGRALVRACRTAMFQERVRKVHTLLLKNLTTVGINQTITRFFLYVQDDIHQLSIEARLANRLVQSIYERHADTNGHTLPPPLFLTDDYLKELNAIQDKADHFRKRLSTVLTEQHLVIRRFFNTLVREVIVLHERIKTDADQWADQALLPLTQHALEQKQLLERQLVQLKTLNRDNANRKQLLGKLDEFMADTEHQLVKIDHILKNTRQRINSAKSSNVVVLHERPVMA